MNTEILKLKMMRKYYNSAQTRFVCSPDDFRNLIRERKVNLLGQLLSNPAISVRPESGVILGNVVYDSVTLN